MRRIRDKSNLVVAFAFLVIIAIFVSIFLKNLNGSSSIATTIDEDVPKALAPAEATEENKVKKESTKRIFSKDDLTIDEDLIDDTNVNATVEKKEEKKQVAEKQEINVEKKQESKPASSVEITIESKEENKSTGTEINQVSSEEDNGNATSQNKVEENNNSNTENNETNTNQNESQDTNKPVEVQETTNTSDNAVTPAPETNTEN